MFPSWQPMQAGFVQPQYQMVQIQQNPYQWVNAPQQRAVGPFQQQPPIPPTPPDEPAAPPPSEPQPPPPSDEKPPLPPEPPPPDTAPEQPQKELEAKDPAEVHRLQQLQQQAAQWQQTQQYQQHPQQPGMWGQQQQQQSQWLGQQQQAGWGQYNPGMQAQTPQPPQPMMGYNSQGVMDALLQEEAEFNIQYQQWKKQYDEWREQNKSHPNKDQFQQYLQQWQMYEKQMEEKKADIQKRKDAASATAPAAPQPQQPPQPPQPPSSQPQSSQPQSSQYSQSTSNQQQGNSNSQVPSYQQRPQGPQGPRFEGSRFSGPGGPNSGSRFPGPRGPNAASRFSGPEGPYSGPRGSFGPRGPRGPGFRPGFNEGPRGMAPNKPEPSGGSEPQQLRPPGTEQKEQGEADMVLDDDDSQGSVTIIEEFLNSDDTALNKFMIKQLNEDAREVLNRLGEPGREIMSAFSSMNPAQLNKFVKFINSLGEEAMLMKDMGQQLTPFILRRMQNDILKEKFTVESKDNKPPEGPPNQFGRGQRFEGPHGDGGPRGMRPRFGGPRFGYDAPRGGMGPMGRGMGPRFGPRGPRFDGARFGGPRYGGPQRPEDGSGEGQYEEPDESEWQGEQEAYASEQTAEEEYEGEAEEAGYEDQTGTQYDGEDTQFSAPQGPRFAGPRFGGNNIRGPRPGGPYGQGPAGPYQQGPRGPRQQGPGGPRQMGPGGPRQQGPGGLRQQGPGGLRQQGPGGLRQQGPSIPRQQGPGGPPGMRQPGPRGMRPQGPRGPWQGPGGPYQQGPRGAGPGGPGQQGPAAGGYEQGLEKRGPVSLMSLSFNEPPKGIHKTDQSGEDGDVEEATENTDVSKEVPSSKVPGFQPKTSSQSSPPTSTAPPTSQAGATNPPTEDEIIVIDDSSKPDDPETAQEAGQDFPGANVPPTSQAQQPPGPPVGPRGPRPGQTGSGHMESDPPGFPQYQQEERDRQFRGQMPVRGMRGRGEPMDRNRDRSWNRNDNRQFQEEDRAGFWRGGPGRGGPGRGRGMRGGRGGVGRGGNNNGLYEEQAGYGQEDVPHAPGEYGGDVPEEEERDLPRFGPPPENIRNRSREPDLPFNRDRVMEEGRRFGGPREEFGGYRGRNSPSMRDPYGPPLDPYERDRFDPYRDPYREERRDPYWDVRDPYERRDPYGYPELDRRRPAYDEPFGRGGLEDRYRDPYRPISEFKPAETIDYGHKPSATTASLYEREEPVKPFVPPTVIDYGHGQTVDDRPGRDRSGSREPDRYHTPPQEDDRFGWERDKGRDRPRQHERDPPFESSFGRPPPPVPAPKPVVHEPKVETSKVEDILCPPGRAGRPSQIVVIVRGLPGSGKTYVSKLIKDKEVANGGSAPRMLCLDDYFMIEVDRLEKDPESGKRVKRKILEYEYEAEMESSYRQNMLKSFKKTIDDGFFPFIIVDAVFDRVRHFEEFWSYAKSKGFQVYVAELQADVATCVKRNTHKRSQRELEKLQNKWDETPKHYIRLDIRSLLQEDSITEVEMEELDTAETSAPAASAAAAPKADEDEDDDDDVDLGVFRKSRWELDLSESHLDKLDGINMGKKGLHHTAQSMDEFMQLADEYFQRQQQDPNKKRVRWADLEEKKEQNYRRELGFVVGQTQQDWERITDDSFADRQLNRTKYF